MKFVATSPHIGHKIHPSKCKTHCGIFYKIACTQKGSVRAVGGIQRNFRPMPAPGCPARTPDSRPRVPGSPARCPPDLPPMICRRCADDLLTICRRFTDDLPMICRRFAENLQTMYRRSADDLPTICRRFASDLPPICSKFADDLPTILPPSKYYHTPHKCGHE